MQTNLIHVNNLQFEYFKDWCFIVSFCRYVNYFSTKQQWPQELHVNFLAVKKTLKNNLNQMQKCFHA